MSELITAVADGVMTLTINRPDKRNALSFDVIAGLAEGMARAELEAEVRVVVVRGAGKDFCAGADLQELLASVDRTIDENERDALHLGEVFLRTASRLGRDVLHGLFHLLRKRT